MSLIRIVNKLKSQLFLNSLNQRLWPGGSIVISQQQFDLDAELVQAKSLGYIEVEDVIEEKPEDEESADLEQIVQESQEEIVEQAAEEPEPEPEPEKEKPYRTSEFTDEQANQPPKKAAATVATPEGPRKTGPFKMGTPEHLAERLKGKDAIPGGEDGADVPEKKEDKEYIDGIEVINTTAEEPPSETIDGIEIIDTNKDDAEELGEQFIEADIRPTEPPRHNF